MLKKFKEQLVSRYSLRMRRLEEQNKALDDSDTDKADDAKVTYPLMPNDPSAGFIEVQGHYLVHLAFFVALQAFVELKGETFCFERSKTGTWTKTAAADAGQTNSN